MTEGEIILLKEQCSRYEEEVKKLQREIQLHGRNLQSGRDLDLSDVRTDLLEKRDMLKREIKEIQDRLSRAVIVSGNGTYVSVGSKVCFKFLDGNMKGKTLERIITDNHGDQQLGTICSKAPLAEALLNHTKGDKVSYTVGERSYSVLILDVK